MKQTYPKLLYFLAKRARVPANRAENLWMEALRFAAAESSVIESPEYWKVAADRLLEGIAANSFVRNAAQAADAQQLNILGYV